MENTFNKMELINRLSVRRLNEGEVYTFNITLCDNEIDRDLEVFNINALKVLSKLFIGKIGICDYRNVARIYDTWIETDKTRKTNIGEFYTKLKASAYIVKKKENEDLINIIESGLSKEISIGCAAKERICSICNNPLGGSKASRNHNHIKGKEYNGKICCHILSDITDAYEWSFVIEPKKG